MCVLFAQEIALQIKQRLTSILFCQGCRQFGLSWLLSAIQLWGE